jgi:Carboxypeptidase regulatory-like domain
MRADFLVVLLGVTVTVATSGASAQSSKNARPANATAGKADDCSVAGKVVKLAGSEPLRNAIVIMQSMDDRPRTASTVHTDSGGRFLLKGILPGQYRMKVMRTGFVSQEFGQRGVNATGAIMTLVPGQEMKDLLFRLIPAAIISGHLENEDGDPLPWAHVSALHEMYADGKRTLSSEDTVPTNDRGEYRLFGLRPGRYFISAVFHPGATRVGDSENDEFGEIEGEKENYVRTYYPGTPDATKAEAITVRAGEEIPSMDFMLRPTAVYRVKGHITNLLATDSKRSRGIMVFATPRNSAVLAAHMTFGQGNMAKPDGSFDLPGVLPGSYTVTAQWSDDGKAHTARQNIEVGNADVEGLQLTIAKGVPVVGHLRWEGKPSLIGDQLTVVAQSADDTVRAGYARVDADGSFAWTEVAEGEFRVRVFGQSQDSFVKAARYGSADALTDGFTPRAGSGATLEITLSSRGAHVQGSASDADGLPAVGVWVVLVPEGKGRELRDLYKTAQTDQHGQFQIRGAAPGDYKLFSCDQVEQGAWEDPDFLKPFEGNGEKVTVEEGETKSVNVTTIKAASTEEPRP